jgi:hypothetical protein
VPGALFGSVALAAIPGATGVITGCCDKKSGELRVIDAEAGKTCKRDEQQISWNQTGPQGLPGPKGDKGHLAGGIPIAATTGSCPLSPREGRG